MENSPPAAVLKSAVGCSDLARTDAVQQTIKVLLAPKAAASGLVCKTSHLNKKSPVGSWNLVLLKRSASVLHSTRFGASSARTQSFHRLRAAYRVYFFLCNLKTGVVTWSSVINS